MQENDSWLTITDTEMSSADLVTEVEQRVQQRRQVLGEVHPQIPDFGVISPVPEVALNYTALAHHLRLVNDMDPPPMSPVLTTSPATRIPLFGKLWQLVRGQFHELILFYVNRAVSHETKIDNHIISTLNELTHIIQDQQTEIERLQEAMRKLEEEQK